MKARKNVSPKLLSDRRINHILAEEDNPRRFRTGPDCHSDGVDPSETALFSLQGLPSSPLEPIDVPRKLRTITQHELEGYVNAEHNYRVAKADFERKHGNLALKLILVCGVEDGNIRANLDQDGRIVVTEVDKSSVHPRTRARYEETTRS